jgi:hypothetical protein
MFEWLWGCMALSFKTAIGAFCWVFAVVIVCAIIGGIITALDR